MIPYSGKTPPQNPRPLFFGANRFSPDHCFWVGVVGGGGGWGGWGGGGVVGVGGTTTVARRTCNISREAFQCVPARVGILQPRRAYAGIKGLLSYNAKSTGLNTRRASAGAWLTNSAQRSPRHCQQLGEVPVGPKRRSLHTTRHLAVTKIPAQAILVNRPIPFKGGITNTMTRPERETACSPTRFNSGRRRTGADRSAALLYLSGILAAITYLLWQGAGNLSDQHLSTRHFRYDLVALLPTQGATAHSPHGNITKQRRRGSQARVLQLINNYRRPLWDSLLLMAD